MTTQPVNFNSSIEEMTGLIARTLEGVRIGKVLAPDLWMSVADRNQIKLAILNLAINARDAMPVGGTFTIETSNEHLSRLQDDGLMPGDYVAIKLTDTGTGMPPEVLGRAIDPFYTTKPEGKGTGLGLSMVYGMVRQLGGGLRITSEVGKGTAITILLPRAQAISETSTPALPIEAPQSASILLVEDDPDTRAVVRAYAADLGLSVVLAETGSEALALLAAGRLVDVLIADATLPGIAGPTLIDEVQARYPEVQGLLMSGHPELAYSAQASKIPVLAKPFNVIAFKRALLPLLRNGEGSENVVDIRSEVSKRGG